ncbi:MAG: class I SAM-dependent methyltransferase, partial [Opitutaceae bacterium]|nr:class I SAM-dependent methyltransferase [Opitutaceae bacterium]
MWGFGKKPKYRIFLDTPTEQIFEEIIKIEGWYAGESPLQKLFIDATEIESFELMKRSDVENEFSHLEHVTGFRLILDSRKMSGKTDLSVRAISITGETTDLTKTLTPSNSWKLKQEKMIRIKSLLRLDLPHEQHPLRYDFLSDEQREKGGLVSATAISSHSYTKEMLTAIKGVSSSCWILDCGAGHRETIHPNVVHFEIEPYVSTDVRGICEELPFKDNSFDLIFSLVVLEHVKDPFTAVREMERVLKPGGSIWV